MKKILLFVFIAFTINTKAQISFEFDYDSASTFASGTPAICDQLELIHFEVSGDKYIKINRHGKKIEIYNLNHVHLKTIDYSILPLADNGGSAPWFLYFSENLFDIDSGIEFMYLCYLNGKPYTGIYNDDCTLIFSDTALALILQNWPPQQYPIYNTTDGTKMILSYENGHAKVFSLPGTLSDAIAEANNVLVSQSSVSNAYPNPTNNTTQIDYTLPEGVDQGEIAFYDLLGNEVKRFKVDRTFNTLLVSTSDIAAGTYYYQLQTTAENSEGKKMVVIK